MTTDRQPLVSIGVPVFNGEAGIARCLDSLLEQDYQNLEIVISDNASRDATQPICERYARLDSRVKYVRADRNVGAIHNFNRVFELSRGEYFAWAAHDDVRERSFVRACVERLEQRPDAVLCQGHTAVYVEPHDEVVYVANFDTLEGKAGVVERYRESLKRLSPMAIYGLYRSSAMRKTLMFQAVMGTDTSFVQELLIHGRLLQVPRILFRYHARQTWNSIDQDARVFLRRDRKPWWYVPFVMLFLNHWSRVGHARVPFGMKARLWSVLVCHEAQQLALKIIFTMAGVLCPEHRKEQLGQAVWRRWMHDPNLDVIREDVFFQRVCKPQLGWWR